MRYRSDLERLATLDAAAIEAVCTDCTTIDEYIACAVDKSIEHDALADEFEAFDEPEEAAFLWQEAAAWRATARLLRTVAADPEAYTGESGRDRPHGVA
ncbi:hypothetical protein [Gordonia paraffinivorans]|uniref:hypothetical protein n=1 Tax=Gordonia paraffinivorans TaxID=175628 RepID=UPI0014454908|nr:hypothetical protein [Gordonia paraffinivorans]